MNLSSRCPLAAIKSTGAIGTDGGRSSDFSGGPHWEAVRHVLEKNACWIRAQTDQLGTRQHGIPLASYKEQEYGRSFTQRPTEGEFVRQHTDVIV